jgi:hypothetical protein
MALHVENFVSIRKQLSRQSVVAQAQTGVQPPATKDEHDYRDLLSAANAEFLHREYAIALDHYLELRHKILVQSHPEMPGAPGGLFDVSVAVVDWHRIVELSRRHLAVTEPGGRVNLDLKDRRLIASGEFPVNQALRALGPVGLDPQLASASELTAQRVSARERVLEGDLAGAQKVYTAARDQALRRGDVRVAAEVTAEAAAMTATYADGPDRPRALTIAAEAFTEAGHLFAQAGDDQAQELMRANAANATSEAGGVGPTRPVGPEGPPRPGMSASGSSSATPGVALAASTSRLVSAVRGALPQPRSTNFYRVPTTDGVRAAGSLLATRTTATTGDRQVGLYFTAGTKSISLARASFESGLLDGVYKPRIMATTLEGLTFWEHIETNFVAYIPHLFFFMLPIAIGDTYVALGRYQKALDEYQSSLSYPFLNLGIEAPYVWLRMAKACLRWGDELFRQDAPAAAKQQYEKILNTDLTVPLASPLYQPAAMAQMRTLVAEVIKDLKGQPHGEVNPAVATLVTQAHVQLRKIAAGLNFLGLGADDFPVLRFKYLQAAANYLADNAIQAERTFLSFRASAEQQKLDRLQLENAVEVNQGMLAIEQKRLTDANLERTAARQTREYAQLRQAHAQATIDDWNTLGRELASVNAALSWASNAANDQDIRYTGVRYHGERHDFDTTVEDFYDTVGEWRENLNFEIQRRRLERQVSEAAAEVALGQTREQQAQVRYEIQALSVGVAQKRLDGAREILEYSRDRMLDEDLWFQLAGELQDLARSYLDMAIYAAFLMQRAYELEFDRSMGLIRLDYGIGGVQNLLGGDYLKRDIAAFTIDYMQHAQKKNPVRLPISLRDEFPAEFQAFLTQGILPFRTDLELFDRRYPGTYRRKLKKVELFVEGLVPLEGVNGVLLHQGLSTEWRKVGGAWVKHTRAMPAERMVLSSYQFRRDLAVFQPSEEMLDLFENLGPQGNWRLELPRSSNNLDYEAVSDVKLVLYFDADFSDELLAHVRTFYPADGGRSLVLSSRFHFPDQYFRLDADRRVAFQLHPARVAYNYVNCRLSGLAVRLVPTTGASLANVPLTVTRASDSSSASGTTNADGLLQGAPTTMAPFGAWRNASPLDIFTVSLGDSVDLTTVADIQLAVDYAFDYRPDGVVAA